MAYVRRKGSQIAIVAGKRNLETKQVEQRILFTLYSRPEALDVLGRGEDKSAAKRFEILMARQHPGVLFDWKAIRKAIAADLDHLPASYEYRASRLTSSFRKSLVELVRSLMLADPQQIASAGALIRENRAALGYLSQLIEWRTATCAERAPNEWTTDNPYFWRFSMPGKGVPPDVEEHAAGLRERGETIHAEAGFELMVEAFPDYAAGHNFLGLLALEKEATRARRGFVSQGYRAGKKAFFQSGSRALPGGVTTQRVPTFAGSEISPIRSSGVDATMKRPLSSIASSGNALTTKRPCHFAD